MATEQPRPDQPGRPAPEHAPAGFDTGASTAASSEMDREKAELYARDISDAEWIRYGEDTTGEGCVETAEIGGGAVAMRNSAHPEGPILRFTAGEWEAFVLGVRDGEFDLDRL